VLESPSGVVSYSNFDAGVPSVVADDCIHVDGFLYLSEHPARQNLLQ